MADHGRVLLLPVHAALGAGRHDAAARRGFGLRRRRGLAGRTLLLRLFAVQPGGRSGPGPLGRAGWSRWARRPSASGRCCSPWEQRAASAGRLLQGAGGVFALVGAVYIATTSFPASRAATLIGATQMFGMAGGSAGQFVVGPLIARRPPLEPLLDRHGRRRPGHRRLLCLLLRDETAASGDWLRSAGRAMAPRAAQPAIDPVRHHLGPPLHPDDDLRHGLGRPLPAGGARLRLRHRRSIRSATVPLGWIIGCPLLGLVSDRIGRRKPVDRRPAPRADGEPGLDPLRPADVLPPYVLGLIDRNRIGRGHAALHGDQGGQPARVSGTATGLVNFLNFTFSALLAQLLSLLRRRGDRPAWCSGTTRRRSCPSLYGVRSPSSSPSCGRRARGAARRRLRSAEAAR